MCFRSGPFGSGLSNVMKTWKYALCSVVWMSFIFILSSLPGDRLGPDTATIIFIKKTGHAVIFGVLAGLYLWTFKGRRSLGETGRAFFSLSFVLTVLYAVTDEYHQSFTPGRHAAATDVVIDACGAFICLGSLYGIKLGEKRC